MPAHVNEHLGPVHNSHLVSVRRCKRKFKFAFIEGIQPRTPALPLARGVWLHYCLQAQFLKWGLDDGTLLLIPKTIHIDGVGEVPLTLTETKGWVLSVQINEEGDHDIYPLSAAGMLRLLIDHVWNRLFPQEHEKYTEDDHTLPEAVKRILEEYFYFYKEKFQERTFDILLVEVDWKREYKGIEWEGRSDYVIRMRDSGLIICGDWKSTKRDPHPEYKFMESQLHLYPWGIAPMLIELGIPQKDVEAMAVEFDYLSTKLPTIPQQNKDGRLSVRKINTTYLTLTRSLKMYGLKWSEEDIEAFLAKNEKVFFDTKRLPRNLKVVKRLLEENTKDAHIIGELIDDPSLATRTVSYNCSFDCDFMPLCKGELYGQNVSAILKKDYEPRSNTHAGVVEKDD